MYRNRMKLLGLLLVPVLAAQAGEEAEKNIREGALESRVDALASIQPGLGVIMHEMGFGLPMFIGRPRAVTGGWRSIN